MNTNTILLGQNLRKLRKKNNYTLNNISSLLNIQLTYLSKIENGIKKPSEKLLLQLAKEYKISENELLQLVLWAGYSSGRQNKHEVIGKTVENQREEVKEFMEQNNSNIEHLNNQIQVPNNLPVLYTDSAFVTINQYGLVFDFAQSLGPTNTQNVVARIGMSKEHAEALLKVLNKKIVELETLQKKKKVENN